MPSASGVFRHGQQTVGTSAVQLTSTAHIVVFGVLVKADNGNTGNVYVGWKGVTTSTGFRLSAGEGIFIEVDNPTKVYLIADADNQKVYWVGV